MKDSGRGGRWKKGTIFRYGQLDEDGTGNYFETDQGENDTPTLYLSSGRTPNNMKSGIIRRIHYRLNPTNAVTYTLRLYAKAVAPNYQSGMSKLYDSGAAKADDTEYDVAVEIPFILLVKGKLYYAIEWSAAPGDTTGYIEVMGEVIS